MTEIRARWIEPSHPPFHLFDPRSIPWTTACGLRLHQDDGSESKVSATTSLEDVECESCRAAA